MKKKIITILVTITFITGAGTAAGVIIDKQIKTEEASVSEEMTSSTLPKTSAKTESSETITEKNSESKRSAAKNASPTEAQTTENQPEDTTTTTTTEFATKMINQKDTPTDKPIKYYQTFYKVAIINEELYNIFKLSGNGPNVGKYAYYNNNIIKEKEYLLNDIDNIEFTDCSQVGKKFYDKNNEPYWQPSTEILFSKDDYLICYDNEGKMFHFDEEENRIYI